MGVCSVFSNYLKVCYSFFEPLCGSCDVSRVDGIESVIEV